MTEPQASSEASSEETSLPPPPPPLLLSRAYTARSTAPTVDKVDPRIFTYTYFMACMDCTSCHDQCCSYGVGIDLDNVERLKAITAELAPYTVGRPEEWFEDWSEEEPDYPGGRATDTRVVKLPAAPPGTVRSLTAATSPTGGACAFRRPDDRGCAIHYYSLERGIDYHTIKPIYCSLFPVTVDEQTLCPSLEVEDGSLICLGKGASIYRGVRHELAYYFGDALVAELDAMEAAATAAS